MSWINKFDTLFHWIFSFPGFFMSIAIVLIFCFLNFYVFRYKKIDERFINKDSYHLSIDKYKSKCIVCQTENAPTTNYHYVLQKNNKIILRWRMICYYEGYNSHPFISAYKNDTIVIGDRKANCLVLMNVPSSKRELSLYDTKFEFIDKSGSFTVNSNLGLEQNRYCYEDY